MSLLKELYAKDELPYDKFMRLGPDSFFDTFLVSEEFLGNFRKIL